MRKRYWLGIVISALLLYLTFRSVEMASVASALRQADLTFLIPALALYFMGVFVRTVRWFLLMRPVQRIGLGRLFVVVVVGYAANNLLPFRAGEAVRAFMLWKRERIPPGTTIGTIVVERIFDGLALTGFLVLVGILLPLDSWLARVAWAAGIAFVVAVIVVFAITAAPARFLRISRAVLRPFPGRVRDLGFKLSSTFIGGLGVLRSARSTLLVGALSLVAWTLEAGMYFALMFSFPFSAGFLAAILGTAAANLGTMIPSAPGYIGTFDLLLSSALIGTFAIEASIATSYTLLVHAALIVPVSILGLVFLWREGLSLRRVSAEAQRERDGEPQRERGAGAPGASEEGVGVLQRRSPM
jgi:glycosyltransferase 2 family protein